MSEKRRALIIANLDYQASTLRRLTSPAEDAKELANVLGDPAIGGFEVETLLNEKSAVVSHTMEEFFVFSNPKPDDLLLLYFSGHGVTDEEGKLYLATTDTQFARQSVRRSSAVSADFVDQVMRRSRSRRQILLLDCCHGGAFAEGMSLKGPLPGLESHFQGRGRMVLAASTAVQFSQEGLNQSGQQQPSVYTRILVEGLRSGDADRDGDGWVSLDELHDYVSDRVGAEAPQQTPTKSGHLEGQLYIARTRILRPVELPGTLRVALNDPALFTRRGAVYELKDLLQGEHPGLALAARRALEELRDKDDSFKIRGAAEEALAAHAVDAPTKTPVELPAAKKADTATSSIRTKAAPAAPLPVRDSGPTIIDAAGSYSGLDEKRPAASFRFQIVASAFAVGLVWSVLSIVHLFYARSIVRSIHELSLVATALVDGVVEILLWGIGGLLFALVLTRFSVRLRRRQVALLAFIWPLTHGLRVLFGLHGSLLIELNQVLVGAVSGLILARALKSDRWIGILVGAFAFGLGWSSYVYLGFTYLSFSGVFSSLLALSLGAGLSIWYVRAHADNKQDEI